ncbi:helix-turn-helix domain-containing protein [Ornithinimicrobium faecis]|uniref:Helix-turn-helix domain-containing protein n=1 Tax=Ornithinimicrobium faecis TaxID=2934158 RepID=A0ABY4YZ57_9MICO|nr:helix-turn-helix domain-containing protein [Ornithinimicrobium sp. HY1793]USQ82074.1 helix-turn-helix domain-containing protein [Ornithinimicrobium sp. HY1793]
MARQQVSQGLDLLRSDVRRRLYSLLSDLPAGAGSAAESSQQRGLSAQELADVVGLHLTTVRFHLDQLVAAGLLTAVQARPVGAGRPRKLYVVPGVAADAPTDPDALQAYAVLTEIVGQANGADGAPDGALSQGADGGDDAEGAQPRPALLEQSGWAWARDHVDRLASRVNDRSPATTPGAWLGKIGAVLDLLVGWGHSPEVRTAAGAREVDIVMRDCPFMALAKEQPQMVCGVHRGLLRGALDALGEESAELDLQPLVDWHTCRAHLTVTTPFADRGEQR